MRGSLRNNPKFTPPPPIKYHRWLGTGAFNEISYMLLGDP